MFEALSQSLETEIEILNALIKLEREKRTAILIADGKHLQHATDRTEVLLGSLDRAHKKRAKISADEPLRNSSASLSVILEAAERQAPGELAGLRELAGKYREAATILKTETVENNELLARARGSMGRMLSGLKKLADSETGKTYAPAGTQSKAAGSVILNANA